MINNKKGLSTVVTTLIIILLVLVAIGIIWIVIRGVIETGTGSVDYSVKCLKIDVRATNVSNCNGINCSVTLTRKDSSGDAIGGVKMVFYNSSGVSSSTPIDLKVTIDPLTSKTNIITTGVNITFGSTGNKVNVNAYLFDEKGLPQICTTTNTYTF